MKSIRDLVNRMPETRKGLEDYVLASSPTIREAVEQNPRYRDLLSRKVDEAFDEYGKYFGGLTQKLSAAGHGVGYTADAYFLANPVAGLGGKFLHLLAQIPEKLYSVVYAVRTGNYTDSLRNIFEGLISYVPGLTVADEGLSRIVQKRMVKNVTYEMERALGKEKSWYERTAEKAKEAGYSNVEPRGANIIRPFRRREKLAA